MSLGMVVLVVCFLAAIYAFVSYFSGNVEDGWTSIILSIWFLGGVQLISIGLIGEYILTMNKRLMKRPLVIEEERLNFTDKIEEK